MISLDRVITSFLSYALVQRRLSPGTIAHYRRHLKRYVSYLRGQGLEDVALVTEIDASAFVQAVYGTFSADELAAAIAAVKAFHLFCKDVGYSREDPAFALEGPRRRRRLPTSLSTGEIEQLLAVPNPKTAVGLRDLALLEFGYATGARAAEWARVRVNDFQSGLRFVRLYGKGNKERAVPVGRYARVAISRYLRDGRPLLWHKKRSNDQLFLNVYGRPLQAQCLSRIVKSVGHTAGIGKTVTPHVMRHTFATHLLMGGAGLEVIQALLGHADISTTQIYLHVDVTYLRVVHQQSHPSTNSEAINGKEL